MDLLRARDPFRYSTADDPQSSPATPLDEAQQETLISNLTRENSHKNELYTYTLLAVLALSALIPLLRLFSAPVSSLLSLSCLGAQIYVLLLPLDQGGVGRYAYSSRSKGKRPIRTDWDRRIVRMQEIGDGIMRRLGLEGREGTLEKWIPIGGASLAVLLAIDGLVLWQQGGVQSGRGLDLVVPAITAIVVLVARTLMKSVDVGSLQRLRYELKGA